MSTLTVPVFCLPLFFPPLRIFCLDGHKVAPAVVHNDTGEEPVRVSGISYKGKVDCIGGAPVAAKLIDTTMSVHCHHDALVVSIEVTEKLLPGKCGNNIGMRTISTRIFSPRCPINVCKYCEPATFL